MRFPEFTEEWKKCTIGELAIKVGSGVTPRGGESVYKMDGHPFVRSQNVGLGHLILDDIAFIDEETHLRQKSTELKLEDVLLNITGASIGRSALVNEQVVGGNVNQHVCIIRTKESLIPSFLCNFLLSNYGQRQIDSFQAGGNRQGLNFEQIKSIKIAIPSTKEQTKVAKLLQLIEERIATQNKIIEDLKKLKSAITNLLFHSIIEVNTVRLGDIAHITNGVGDVQDANTEYRKDWYPFFDRSEELKWFPTYSFDKEAIIYAGEGQSFYPRYYKGKFALHQRCYAITDFTSCILPRYCYHFMTTLNSYFIRNSVGSTVPSLRMDIFQKAEIKLPPISKQQHICKIIDALYAKLEVEHNTLNSLQLQKQHMLRQMFI
ncbi:restriction endonuclease subunit S [Bacteroides fragilis]|uniref:restriction endonuclease subunit S n=1 Tax=Bacteroides fragilis TaxID=817 RepID=UPI0039B5ED59